MFHAVDRADNGRPKKQFEGGDAVVIQLEGSQSKRLKPGRDSHQIEWDDLLAAVVANPTLQRTRAS